MVLIELVLCDNRYLEVRTAMKTELNLYLIANGSSRVPMSNVQRTRRRAPRDTIAAGALAIKPSVASHPDGSAPESGERAFISTKRPSNKVRPSAWYADVCVLELTKG